MNSSRKDCRSLEIITTAGCQNDFTFELESYIADDEVVIPPTASREINLTGYTLEAIFAKDFYSDPIARIEMGSELYIEKYNDPPLIRLRVNEAVSALLPVRDGFLDNCSCDFFPTCVLQINGLIGGDRYPLVVEAIENRGGLV